MVGHTITLKATALYEDGTQAPALAVEWKSSVPANATVTDGVVSGAATGTTDITATVNGVTSDPLTITVIPVPVESVAFTSTVNSGVLGTDVTLTAEITPEDATDKTLTWESSKPDVAAFTKTGAPAGGKILSLLKAGATTITVTAGGKTATMEFTVENPPLDALTVTAEARAGGQTLTVAEALGTDLQRRYKITAAADKPTVTYDQVLATADGWQAYPANGQVSGAEGDVATVVDVRNKGANARAVGTVTLPAPLA